MNKVFSVVWDETLESWVVVSEMAKSKVKTQRIKFKKAISQIIVSSLTVIPASFVLADGIYINSSDNSICGNVNSIGTSGSHEDGDIRETQLCEPRDISNQHNRILFYGVVGNDTTSSDTINLMVAGTTYINSGNLGLGGGQENTDAKGSLRIGGGIAANTSLDMYGEPRNAAGTLGAKSGKYAIAIGGGETTKTATIAREDFAIALGYNSQANAISSIAFGDNIMVGDQADAAIAIGSGATVGKGSSTATVVGSFASVAENTITATAVGSGASATLTNSVALGAGSETTSSIINSSYLTGQIVSENNVVSVGTESLKRRIQNLADGAEDSDAVTVAQLRTVTTASTSGGFGLKAEDDNEVKQNLGETIELVGADSNISTKVNNGQVKIELNKDLTGLDSVEVVDATDPTKKTTTTGAGTVVIDGDNTSTLAATGITVTDGINTSVYDVNGVNINNGSVILNNAGLTVGNVTIGNSGINAGGNTISNVGTAEKDDEAVNLGQLKDMLSTSGTGGSGGIQYDDPTTKDSVTLGGENGTTISNLKDGTIVKSSTEAVNGGQIFDLQENLQNQITNNTNDISNLQNQINNIDGNSLVQQATPDSDVTIAAGTGGKNVNIAGTDGDRRVTGVADGNISSTSTNAVNGSQLQANYDNVAAGLGGGAKYENGTWTGPEYTVGDTTVTNVGDAIDALNKSDQQLDSQLTNLSNKVDNMYITTNERIDRLEKDTNSGIASAIAIASLPQPTEKGYTMMSAGTGVWKGEVGLAIGASGVTEDKVLFKKPVNYVWKFASTFDTRSNWGGGASVGVQWK